MSDKMRAALVGGVTWGVLSTIPGVNFLNFFCCAWIVMGGALASYLYVKKSPQPVLRAEGGQIGALTGVVGTLVSWAIGIPLSLLFGETTNALLVKAMQTFNPGQAEEFRQMLEQAQATPISQRLPYIVVSALVGAVVYVAFATLGGLLGVSIFEKRKADAAGNYGGAAPPPGAPPRTGPGGPFGEGR